MARWGNMRCSKCGTESVFEKFRILGEGESIKSSSGEPDAESTLQHGLDGYSLETGEPITAGGSAWWAAAHDQYTGGRKRHLLSITNGLPMAPASPSLSTVEHGLLLFSKLGELWSLGTAASCHL